MPIPQNARTPPVEASSKGEASQAAISTALRDTEAKDNDLLSPVIIPEDANGVLKRDHPSTNILANSSIVVTRQLELMNVIGLYDQANKYTIMDPQGNHLGYIVEKDTMGSSIARQFTSTRRPFTAHVFDRYNREVLRIRRPFSYINSRIHVYDPQEIATDAMSSSTALQTEVKNEAQVSPLALSDMRVIGEAQQQWAPLRRKYNLFLARQGQDPHVEDAPRLMAGDLPISNSKELTTVSDQSSSNAMTGSFDQFAYVDEPFLSWDFSLKSSDHKLIGSVNRNFSGFGREIFTDTGVYALRMDAAGSPSGAEALSSNDQVKTYDDDEKRIGMTLDQRAVMLATAICVDFDYFSRKSGNNGIMPMWLPVWMGGGGGGGEAGAAGAAGEAGGEAGGGGVGGVAADDASPTNGADSPWGSADSGGAGQPSGGMGEEVWGEQSPWEGGSQGQSGGGGEGGSGGGDGEGGSWFDLDGWL